MNYNLINCSTEKYLIFTIFDFSLTYSWLSTERKRQQRTLKLNNLFLFSILQGVNLWIYKFTPISLRCDKWKHYHMLVLIHNVASDSIIKVQSCFLFSQIFLIFYVDLVVDDKLLLWICGREISKVDFGRYLHLALMKN